MLCIRSYFTHSNFCAQKLTRQIQQTKNHKFAAVVDDRHTVRAGRVRFVGIDPQRPTAE
jgi:hypothetical protein